MGKVLGLVSLFLFIVVGNSFAENQPAHSLDLGVETSYIKYDEPGVMEEEGLMGGLNAAYTYRDGWMGKLSGRFSYGQVDYENSGTIDNIDDYIVELRGLFGYDFFVSDIFTLTPYIGLGYRYLNDDLSGKTSSTGAIGYERESNYFYSPVGVELSAQLGQSDWSWGLTLEYDIFWQGKQKSHLSDVSSSVSDLENDQENGYGLRGSIKLEKEGPERSYLIEPFVRYWDIKQSEVSTITVAGSIWGSGWEPANNSTEVGVRLAVKF